MPVGACNLVVCPIHVCRYSVGMQVGEDPRFLQGIATLKHFDANSLEGNWPGPSSMCPGGVCTRHTIDVNISRYDLASSYLPAFKRSVIEGNGQAVMCSCECL